MSSINSVLKVNRLTKKFDNFIAVDDVSFLLKPGEILGLLGPNGAGKTTTISMLLSTMSQTSGEIFYFNKNFFTHRSEILQEISFASTYVRLPGRLSIMENLDVYGQLYGLPRHQRRERIENLLKFFDMWHMRNRESAILSAGQTTSVMLVKAFLSSPKIVLLDEPTAALDPDIALQVRSFIKEQQVQSGVSVLLTSHNMQEVTEICDRVLVMQSGKIVADNTPAQLAASVKSVYLNLWVVHNEEKAHQYLAGKNITYHQEHNILKIEVNEQAIADLLHDFAHHGIRYSHISIDKPNLEDYFIQIARAARKR